MKLRHAILGALLVSLSIATASALAAVRSGKYKGTNSQTPAQALTFRVSSRGRSVLDFQPAFVVNCSKSGQPNRSVQISTDIGTNMSISHRRFKLHTTKAQIHSGSAVFAVATMNVNGSFPTTHSARGSYSVSFTFNSSAPGGLPGFHCSTGKLTWTASHA